MRNLKIEIRKLLLEHCPNVYSESAPDTATVPYLVYDISQGYENQGQIVFTLDVDIWDKNQSSTKVDDLIMKLRTLNKTVFINNEMQFSLHFDRILNTKSEDLSWKRKTAIFELRYMERR